MEKPWQTAMKQFGVKAARVEVYMTWFFGPRNLAPVRVVYYDSYDIFVGHEQVTDSATLARLRASGLEAKLRVEAIRRAPEGAWLDLPYPFFWVFKAATGVTIWDDPWLPNLPHMFTTFGPGRPPLIAAVGFGDLADIDRLLASGKIDKKSLSDALWYACSDPDPASFERLVKAGADVNQVDFEREHSTCLMIAARMNRPELVRALIASGARVNARDVSGRTALWFAAEGGNADAVKVLLAANAELNAHDQRGMSPLAVATDKQVRALLTAAGARR